MTAFAEALAKRAALAVACAGGHATLAPSVELTATTYGASRWGGHDTIDNGHGYRGDALDDGSQPFSFAELSTNPQAPKVSDLAFNAVMKALPLEVIRLLVAERVLGEFLDPAVGLPHHWPVVIKAVVTGVGNAKLPRVVVARKVDVGRGNVTTKPQIDLRWGLASWLGVETIADGGWQGRITVAVPLPA